MPQLSACLLHVGVVPLQRNPVPQLVGVSATGREMWVASTCPDGSDESAYRCIVSPHCVCVRACVHRERHVGLDPVPSINVLCVRVCYRCV